MGVWDEVDAAAESQDRAAASGAQPAEVAAPAPSSAWDAVDAEAERTTLSRQERLRKLFELGLEKSPDEHAQVAEIARQTRLSAGLVEGQLPVLRKAVAAAKFDPAAFERDNGDLASLLLDYGDADPSARAVVMQDGLLHRALRAIGEIGSFASKVDLGGGSPEDIRAAGFERADRWASGEEAMPAPPDKAAFEPQAVVAQASPSAELTGLDRLTGTSETVPVEGDVVDQGDATIATTTRALVPGIYGAAYDLAARQIEYSDLGAQVVAMKATGQGDRAWELEKKALDMKRTLGPRWYGAGPLESIGLDAMELLPSQVEVLKAGGVGGALGAGIAGGVTLALTRSTEAAAKAARKGWQKGSEAGSFLRSFSLEMGGAYLDYGEMRTDDGHPVSEDLRVGAAVGYGIVAAAVEVDALAPYLEMFGPIGEAVRRGERSAFREAMLKDPTWRNILADAGKRWVKGAYAEGREEVIQQIAQDMFGWYAKSREAGAPQSMDVAGTVLDSADIFAKTFSGTLAFGAAGAASTVVQHVAARESAIQSGNLVAQIAGLGESPSVRASPGLVAEAIAQETAKSGEPVRALQVDAGAFVRLFQDEPGGVAAAAAALGIEEQTVKEAAAGANGGRIEVPLATYLERWGPKGVAQALAPDTAVRPGLPTLREQVTQDAQVQAKRAELVRLYQAENAPAAESPEEQDAIDAVAMQLARTGVYDKGEARKATAIVRAFVRTQAEVAGVEPKDLFSSYVITVDREEARRSAQEAATATQAPGDATARPEVAAAQDGAAAGPDDARRAVDEARRAADAAAAASNRPSDDPDVAAARIALVKAENALAAAEAAPAEAAPEAPAAPAAAPAGVIDPVELASYRVDSAELALMEAQASGDPAAVDQAQADLGHAERELARWQRRLYQADAPSPAAGPLWWSPVERAVEMLPLKGEKATRAEWLVKLKKAPGVKAEELEWMGLIHYLERPDGPKTIDRTMMRSMVEGARVEVREQILGEAAPVPAIAATMREAMLEELAAVNVGVDHDAPGPEAAHAFIVRGVANPHVPVDPTAQREAYLRLTLDDARTMLKAQRKGEVEQVNGVESDAVPRATLEAIDKAGGMVVTIDRGEGWVWYAIDGAPVGNDLVATGAWLAVDSSVASAMRQGFPLTATFFDPVRKELERQRLSSLWEAGEIAPTVAPLVPTATTDPALAGHWRVLSPEGRPVGVGAPGADVMWSWPTREEAQAAADRWQEIGRSAKDQGLYVRSAAEYAQHLANLPRFEGRTLSELSYEGGVGERPEYEGYAVGGHKAGSYRELLLYRPPTEFGSFTSGHFGKHGRELLAHARVSEHTVADGLGTRKVLLIEEIQSDLHQAGREKGYVDAKVDPATLEVTGRPSPQRRTWVLHDPGTGRDMVVREDKAATEGEARAEAADQIARNLREVQSHKGAVADAPWKEGWEELVVKRVLRHAADKGYDRIALTPGGVHTKRWGSELIAWQPLPAEELDSARKPVLRSQIGMRTLRDELAKRLDERRNDAGAPLTREAYVNWARRLRDTAGGVDPHHALETTIRQAAAGSGPHNPVRRDPAAGTLGEVVAAFGKRFGVDVAELLDLDGGPGVYELAVPWQETRDRLVKGVEAWLELTKGRDDTQYVRAREFYERVLGDLKDAYDEAEVLHAIRETGSSDDLVSAVRTLIRTDLDGFGLEDLVRFKPLPGYRVTVKSQAGGEVAGMNLEEAAVARGLVTPQKSVVVATQQELVDAMGELHGWDKARIEKVAAKLWERMQTGEAGAHAPRKEGFEQAYDKRIRSALDKHLKKIGAGKLSVQPLESARSAYTYLKVIPSRMDRLLRERLIAVRDGIYDAEAAQRQSMTEEERAARRASGIEDALTDDQREKMHRIGEILTSIEDTHSWDDLLSGDGYASFLKEQAWLGVQVDDLVQDPRLPAYVAELPEGAREKLRLEGVPLFQDSTKGKRGYVDMMQAGMKRLFDVVFTQRADRSTFLHEAGHIFLEMMGDLAAREGASERLLEDWQRTLKFLGVASRADIGREHHEKWAHAFERYLAEGKAPSLALVGAFQRFKLWLKDVYASLAQVSPDLSDDIRGVFDRMLATDGEIERAKAAMGAAKPLFRTPDEAGMTPEAFVAYLNDREESFSSAAFQAERRAAEEKLRATDAYLRTERAAAAKEAGLEFEERREQVALRFLRKGEAGGNVALQTLLDMAVDAAADTAIAKFTPEEQKRLDELSAAVAELEVERRLVDEVERLVAQGTPRDQAETVARRLLEDAAGDPTRLSSFTRTSHFVVEPGEARALGEGHPTLVAPWRGEALEEGQQIRSVTLPSWLSDEEYVANPLAWEWAWLALEGKERVLDTSGARSKLREVTRKTGQVAAEGVQRIVADYMARALEAFPATDERLLLRGWLLAKLFAPDKDGRREALAGSFKRALQDQVRKWLGTPASARSFEDPLSDKQWGLLARDSARFRKWFVEAEVALKGRPAWMSAGGLTAEEARVEREAAPAEAKRSAELEGRLAALRDEEQAIATAAERRALGKVRPRLDHGAVVSVVGADVAKEKLKGLTQVAGGIAPDELAQILGVGSGAELVQALAQRPERKAWTDARAEELLRARHPDVVAERERLAEIAAQALHNSGTSDWLLKEWVALKRRAISVFNPETGKTEQVPASKLGPEQAKAQIPLESIRLAAQDIADATIVGQITPGKVLAAERGAADRAARAAAAGDFKLAYVEKQKQLLNHYLYRYLTDARDARDAFEKLGAKLTDPARRGLLGRQKGVFLAASDSILEALGFKAAPTDPTELAARPTMPDIVKALEDQGIAQGFDAARLSWLVANPPRPGVTAKGKPIPAWRGLTVADMRLVGSALAQLYVAARDLEQVALEGKRVEIAGLLATIATEAAERLPPVPPPPGSNSQKTMRNRGNARLQGLAASLRDPEAMIKELGPTAYRFFWNGYLDARTAEDHLAEAVFKFIDAKWGELPEEMQRRRYDLLSAADLSLVPFPADVRRDGTLRDRMWAWMVALNMGNRSNMERLLGGYAWDEAQVREFLDKVLTDEEWTFVESVWELLDKELYPLVAAQYEKVNGVRPEKIEALPFTLSSGRVIRGGYFPARYDPVASRLGENQRAEALSKLYAQKAGQYSIARSFTKERVKKFEDVINLQWQEVPRHVGQVIHYVSFDSFIRDAARVMGSSEMKATVEERLGERYYPHLEQWLRTAASDQADAVPEHLADVQWAFGELRSRFVMQTLGLSLTVAAGDLANPLVAIASGKVKARYGAKGMAKATADLGAMFRHTDEAHALSAKYGHNELNHRRDNVRRKVKHELAQIGADVDSEGLHAKAREMAWITMEATDLITGTAIWWGAYYQAQAQGLDVKEAVRAAEAVVRDNAPSHDLAEQPAFLRDKRGVGAIVAFYGYFSKLYNIIADVWQPATVEMMHAHAEGENLRAGGILAHAAGRTLAVILVTNLLSELLSGRGPEDDEGWSEWMLRKVATAPFGWVPVIGQIGEEGINRLVHKAYHGTWARRSFSARASPMMAGIERVARAVATIIDSNKDVDRRVWALLEAYGFFAKIPLGGQVTRTGVAVTGGEAWRDASRGKVVGAAGDLVYGKRVDPRTGQVTQPKNPASAIQDVIDGR